MQTEYFQGKDGYVWWHGVVEDRRDPMFLGRCRVRILGWHTADKAELPTADLPWAYPLMPITSASQVGVGEAPIGPVEGTWVMGYYRDGELAQEPVMVGTLPGIPENLAKKNTGFNDSRLDAPDTNRNMKDKEGTPKPGGSPLNLMAFPFPPKDVFINSGGEVKITEFTHEERASEKASDRLSTSAESYSSFLNPREVNEPTTSKYARGKGDSSSTVETTGIFAFKNRNRLTGMSTSVYNPNADLATHLPTAAWSTYASVSDDTKKIEQPPSAYAAVYPFNHVYESESGHLVEIDDTPTKERLHWYHRSGTFTEFHPKGIRVDRTMGHHYDMVSGNKNLITMGEENRITTNDSVSTIGGKLTMTASKDIRIRSEAGSVTVDSGAGITTVSGNHVLIDAKNTLVLKGAKIVRDDDSAEDEVQGNYALKARGGLNMAGAAKSETITNDAQTTVGGDKKEIVAGGIDVQVGGLGVLRGNKAIKQTATVGGIETGVDTPGPLSSITSRMGPGGAVSKIEQSGIGDIEIKSITGPAGLTLFATKEAVLQGIAQAAVKAAIIAIKAEGQVTIDGQNIQVGGATEPMVLGKTFMSDLMAKHTHESSVGPTTGISPSFTSKIQSSLSKKCFLG
jgi:hypothetical protein